MDLVRLVVCVAFLIRKSTSAFTLTTSPNQATGGESLSFICTTNEDFVTFLKNGKVYCIINFKDDICGFDASSCPPTMINSCSDGQKTMTLPGSLVNSDLNSKWRCSSPFGIGNPSNEIDLIVNIPLQGISLVPNNTITKKEGENQIFKCFAKSVPISTLSWSLNNVVLSTPSPPVTTTDTVTSYYTYVAQKEDNGKSLSCLAVYESNSPLTENVIINVLYRPSVTISPNYSEYKVIENTTNFEFRCTVTAAKPAVKSYRWYKDGVVIVGSINVLHTISTVLRSHTGSYRCDATNDVGTSNRSSVVQLQVLFGAEINNIDKKEPKEGGQLLIMCSVQSNPPVTDNDVTWTKQNNNTFNMKKQQLEISNVNRLDSGTFVCSVVIKLTPTVGQPIDVTGRTTVEVDILYRPSVTISPNHSEFKVIENTTNFEFSCTVTAAKPVVTSYKWYKDGVVIVGSTDVLHTISTVGRSHTGSYTCDATNDVGISAMSSAVQLQVLFGAEINNIVKKEPEEGEQLLILCSVQSNPPVTDNDVTWTKENNKTFSMKQKQLEISNVNRLDSGTFVCSVVIKLTPTVGQPIDVTGRTTVEIEVLYRPSVTISPNHSEYKVIENTTNVEFRCTVTAAKPAVTSYKWYKDGAVIVGSTDVLHTISTVLRSHTGSYTCIAINDVGTSAMSSALQLEVLYGVALHSISKNNKTEGNQLKIACNGESYPVITDNNVRWSKQNNNTFWMNGSHLEIKHVNRVDSGTYICTVVITLTPTVGQSVNVTGTSTVEVDILYRPDVTVSPDKTPYNVNENTTNVNFTCNVKSANPDVMFYRWFKDGIEIFIGATYIIPNVLKSNAGKYECDATNIVGVSDHSSALQLNVLFGVTLQLSELVISINESDRWELSCIGDGNPLPRIICVYGYNRTTVGEQKANVTSIIRDHANCVDTGSYMCSGNNTIGEPVSQSADIKVACKPRTYNNVSEKNVFINGTDESLNLSTTFISFPPSTISWSRQMPDGSLTDLDSEFKPTIITSNLPYETISNLQKEQLKQHEFGIYVVQASNTHGSFLLKYHFIPKRAPDPPSNITASCDVTSINVTWISRFNGGENQTFRINFVNDKTKITITKEGIADKGMNQTIIEENESFSPDTLYMISLETNNIYGTVNSTEVINCTTQKYQEDEQSVPLALVGGITGSISAVLITIIVLGGLYLWRRQQVSGSDKEPIKRCEKETEEEEEGLKDNPLYVTSGEATNAESGPVYGVVNKQMQKKENITSDGKSEKDPVYSQVNTSKVQEKKKQQEKKKKRIPKNAEKSKDIELGTVYENSDNLLKFKSTDEVYANAEEQGNGGKFLKVYSPKKNKDGLIYADLDLIPAPRGNKFVIRGLENRTNYAIIDLSKKAEPLPSDDEDEDKDNGNLKSPENDTNE